MIISNIKRNDNFNHFIISLNVMLVFLLFFFFNCKETLNIKNDNFNHFIISQHMY